MKLTETAVRRPIGTAIIYAAVVLVGAVAVRELAVDLLPEIDFPRISVVTLYDGVGPEEMETLITRPIEQIVSTVEGIDEVESVSAEGISRVQLQFDWGTDLESAVNDVRAQLDRLANRLPEDADRPVVYKFDLSSVPVAFLGLSGGGDARRLRHLAEETISRRLERVSGVAAVDVRGGRVREIRVALNAEQLVNLGVSAQQVWQSLAADNRNVSAGDMLGEDREVLVRTVSEWRAPAEIRDVLVTVKSGRPIYVRDVAEVLDTVAELEAEQWIDGQRGITMSISKRSGANTIEVVEGLREELALINADYDDRVKLTMIWDSSDFIRSSVTNVQTGAFYGAGLAVFVLLFFLRNLRATAVITIAIPLSVVATFGLMYFAGYSLNIISFGGLALGIGMLVDNAIVILENVFRKREEGLGAIDAAIQGAREVAPAVIAGTLTTVAVFAPVVFMGGFASVFFGEMAGVVTFSLLCSLVVALTLVPSLAGRFLRRSRPGASGLRLSSGVGRILDGLDRAYSRLVKGALRAPGLTVLGAVLLLAASLRLVPLVGLELMPETDEGRIDVDIELPVGTPVEHTTKVVREIEQRVRATIEPGELTNVLSSAGPRNWWRPGGGNEGELRLTLVPVDERSRSVETIVTAVRKAVADIPDAEIRVRPSSSNILMRLMRGGGGERLAVEIRGHDLATSTTLAERVREVMTAVDGVSDIRVDREEGLSERAVRVDAERAADLGLTRADVAATIEAYVLGRVPTRLRDAGDEYDVRVQLREEDRRRLAQLEDLPILTPTGNSVPLSAVATIGGRKGPTSIAREGQERMVRVVGGLEGRPLSEVVREVDAALDGLSVPDGFTVSIGGEAEEQAETFSGLLVGVALAILLVYAVMAVQFESLRHPLIVMCSVPFAFIGVVLTLILTGTTLNMNSFLGLIVLVGIVVNNAIVLVDYINLMRRQEGAPLYEAVVESARRRLRPILMTTLTTALAMIPLALGLGEGGEIQAPLARVVVGGLVSSTLVTLVVVPCLYVLTERRRAARQAAVVVPEAA